MIGVEDDACLFDRPRRSRRSGNNRYVEHDNDDTESGARYHGDRWNQHIDEHEHYRNDDFVYEYFGDHNDKVHRTGHREYICGDIGCTAGESSWTPWTSYDWAGFGSRGIPGP